MGFCKLQPMGQILPTIGHLFCKYIFLLEHSTSIHFHPVSGYLYATITELSCVVAVETLWPIKMKVFAT